MTSRRVKQQSQEQPCNTIALLCDSAFCWTGVRQSSRSEASSALWMRIVVDGFQPHPPSMWLTRKNTSTADVAKTFDWDPSMVTQARVIVARASFTSDKKFGGVIGKEFEWNLPDTFLWWQT